MHNRDVFIRLFVRAFGSGTRPTQGILMKFIIGESQIKGAGQIYLGFQSVQHSPYFT
jgi:hypothetical protein